MKWTRQLTQIGLGVIFGITLLSLGVTGWYVKRWIHYRLSYQSQVEARVKPLEERIEQIEQYLHQRDQFRRDNE